MNKYYWAVMRNRLGIYFWNLGTGIRNRSKQRLRLGDNIKTLREDGVWYNLWVYTLGFGPILSSWAILVEIGAQIQWYRYKGNHNTAYLPLFCLLFVFYFTFPKLFPWKSSLFLLELFPFVCVNFCNRLILQLRVLNTDIQ